MGEEEYPAPYETHEDLFSFDTFNPIVEKIISNFDFSELPEFQGKPLQAHLTNLLHDMEAIDPKDSFVDATPFLTEFAKYVHSFFSKEILQSLNYNWPPAIPNADPLRSFVFYYVTLIQSSQKPMNILMWAMANFAPPNWFGDDTNTIKACCACIKGKQFVDNSFFWALLNSHNVFKYYSVDTGLLRLIKKANCGKIEVDENNKSVSIYDQKNQMVTSFTPTDPVQINIWRKLISDEKVPFPLTIAGIGRPIPNPLISSLYEAVTSDDLYVLQTILHYTVIKITDGPEFTSALLDIFSYAGKVSALLTVMVGLEFEIESLTPTTVLRGNSHLTSMFKTFYKRFGDKYFNNVLKEIALKVDEKGDLGIKNPETMRMDEIHELLFWSLHKIINSSKYVPTQIRHLASILKSISGARFNQKQASFNTLSGFFCLRFITAIMASPQTFDESLNLKNGISDVFIPFSQLLQMPFNMMPLSGRHAEMAKWDDELFNDIFPKLMNFVFSVAELNEQPKYDPPPPEVLRQSLEYVLEKISVNNVKFKNRYDEVTQNKSNYSAVGWNIGTFLMNFFNGNAITNV
ncbi:GTPase-activator protein [Histomonas meleagridis]|uniref:GTPase-activator protein n=1 Tax=Histomonas meleagridis TaxID=135588 RepID=UPI00355A24CD|nr:GTPase-activator protein [Histomonas meleagridis]KAH0802912.1 GTPase-activator protein [Histomonas meleagridis]